MCGLLATLATGGCVVIPQGGAFSAGHFWSDFVESGCNWYTAVPTIHQILLLRADKVRAVELAAVCNYDTDAEATSQMWIG
jgi:acyl-CoA synthetase (AMP-forming)/AMP-acid ligase II